MAVENTSTSEYVSEVRETTNELIRRHCEFALPECEGEDAEIVTEIRETLMASQEAPTPQETGEKILEARDLVDKLSGETERLNTLREKINSVARVSEDELVD